MKIYHWGLILLVILWGFWQWFEYDLKIWQIDKHLDNDTSIVEGELVGHEDVPLGKGRHRAISVVEFFVDGNRYFAETDRLKVPKGIMLKVKYEISNPKWHRVIIPDSLTKYHIPNAFYGEDRFYTWPPTEPDDKRISKYNGYRKGPY